MTSEPYVSVIIPVHNRPRELERAVSSVLAQTYSNYEIIIVDDCSTDNTYDVVQELERNDARIRGYRNKRNGGGAYTRNEGAATARGKWIAFLDSDDEWMPEKLQKQIEYMKRCGDGAIICSYFYINKGGHLKRIDGNVIKTGDIRKDLLKGRFGAWTSVLLMKKEYFDRVGGFSSELPSMQDYDLWIKLSEFYRCECVPEFLAVVHTDAEVRISINPSHRVAGITSFFNKWSATIEREVGEEYVEAVRNRTLGAVYYHAALRALSQNDRDLFIQQLSLMKSVGQVTVKRLLIFLYYYSRGFIFRPGNEASGGC